MKTVLLVDDSKVIVNWLETILSQDFKVVEKSTNGIDGIEAYKKHSPDVVLLDITMPNCSGKECLQEIMSFDPKATVIMVSGIGDEGTVNECLQLGAKAFFKKNLLSKANPETSQLLIEAIRSVLSTQTSPENSEIKVAA